MVEPLVPELSNVSVTVGQTAHLTCKAAGDALPHFRFKKRVNNVDIDVDKVPSLRGRTEVKTSSAPKESDFFVHVLSIRNTTFEDAGKYLCLAGNSIGTVSEPTFLFVRGHAGKYLGRSVGRSGCQLLGQ